MDTEDSRDAELVARLRRLDSLTAPALGFGYEGMLHRQEQRQTRARRRQTLVRGSAAAVVIALVSASLWRLAPGGPEASLPVADIVVPAPESTGGQPRIVRANTYLAVAALEEHIASVDDALNVARLNSPGGEDVAYLERTRAELVDSYTRVRYAELLSANF